MDAALLQTVFESERFGPMLGAVGRALVLGDLKAIDPAEEAPELDWNYLLRCASLLSSFEQESAQEAVLRVAQGCLISDGSDPEQRAAATILLERAGNRPAIALAERREMLDPEAWQRASPPLQMDIIKTRLSLTIPMMGGAVSANQFQRQFWSAAATNRWLSVSAPTSAGKSFVVKRWIEDRMRSADSFRGVYLVPTRALIDEVGTELRRHFGDDVGIYEFPWDADIGTREHEVFVLTQERFHLLQQRLPDFAADLVFVDEAQKFGDDDRGVLLQRVLDDALSRSATSQVVFASPLSENPELLLEGAPEGLPSAQLVSESVTVLQNLLWVNQVPRRPREWSVELVTSGTPLHIGTLGLAARPSPESQRLPLIAASLAGDTGSSVIYVNGAGDAEKLASQLFDALGSAADISANSEIQALVELSEKTVHPRYALSRVLRRGVAFHYGNMPLLLRSEIERLFRSGTLRFLVCTSTLLEGVNLPCKNLFVRGPRKGRGRPMTPSDFWNLAGRAGRWGKEFQGNIICIDTSNANQWPDPPRRRIRYPLTRATDAAFSRSPELVAYIEASTPLGEGQGSPSLESVFSFICARRVSGKQLAGLPGLRSVGDAEVSRLQSLVDEKLELVEYPLELVQRHAGISPLAMQRLLEYFREYEDKEALLIAPPESDDAVDSVVRALSRVSRTLDDGFGPDARRFVLSLLIVDWMRGYALARIIAQRVQYFERRNREFKLAALIRDCMADVEQFARFRAPKYLACYVDLLRFHLGELGMTDAMDDLPDVAMLLELGVSRTTELSLMTLGLSRTSAVLLSEHIVGDDLSADECRRWIKAQDLEQLGLPILVAREIVSVVRDSEDTQGAAVTVEEPLDEPDGG